MESGAAQVGLATVSRKVDAVRGRPFPSRGRHLRLDSRSKGECERGVGWDGCLKNDLIDRQTQAARRNDGVTLRKQTWLSPPARAARTLRAHAGRCLPRQGRGACLSMPPGTSSSQSLPIRTRCPSTRHQTTATLPSRPDQALYLACWAASPSWAPARWHGRS
eukprot:365377-Chlamydomonas_euryale.AAC.35